uniref:Uncharacterized protein n=1 Tax=Oryza nivara TaxID=4536 RepID=A0A0E0FI25_ORYNI
MAFFHIPHKSLGENLVPAFGRAATVLRVVSSLGASLRRSFNALTTVDVTSGGTLSHETN